jgi:hypothetical protein
MDNNITLQTKQMIDNLKAVCTNYGLGNASSEYTVDSLHPNRAGGNLLGECICATLRKYGYIN